MRSCPQLGGGEGLSLLLKHRHTEALSSIASQQAPHPLSWSLRLTKEHVEAAVDTRLLHAR